MRPGIFLASLVVLGALGLAIMAGGHVVKSNQSTLATPQEDEATFGSFDQKAPHGYADGIISEAVAGELAPATPAVKAPGEGIAQSAAPTAPGAPVNGQPETDESIGGPWASQYEKKTLYQPIATESGTIDAMGYTLVITGIMPLAPNAKCDFEGRPWSCGVSARTEFRALLRDRAVTCKVPVAPTSRAVLTQCRVGPENEDVGKWLVENGWARAQPAGPYASLGQKSEADKRGIFGPPPSHILPKVLVAPEETNLPEPLPEPGIMATPPADLSGPSQ